MPQEPDDQVLSVLCLDVGQGDATLVIPPGGGSAVVFDCRDAHVVNKHLDAFKIQRQESRRTANEYSAILRVERHVPDRACAVLGAPRSG